MNRSSGSTDRKRILVVENDDETRQFLCVLLYLMGYDVEATSDADSALKAIWRGGFHVLIMAAAMRTIHGRHVLAASRTVQPTTPVVIVADEPPATRDAIIQGDVYAWVCKPLDCVQLLHIAEAAVESAGEMDGGLGPARDSYANVLTAEAPLTE